MGLKYFGASNTTFSLCSTFNIWEGLENKPLSSGNVFYGQGRGGSICGQEGRLHSDRLRAHRNAVLCFSAADGNETEAQISATPTCPDVSLS